MRTRTPYDKFDLSIKSDDIVLEVGSGHNPCYRSNVIVDKYLDDNNSHRCGDIKIFPHQDFINADGESLPFKDSEFDYVICCQVLEHVDDPYKFVKELSRVAKKGYLETPSLIGEFLFPKKSHRWVILDLDDKLIFFEKSKMPGNYLNNYGEVFLNYLPYESLPYKLLWLTEGDLMINRYEWKDSIDIIVNPEDPKYLSYFLNPWDKAMAKSIFKPRSTRQELGNTARALVYMIKRKYLEGRQKQRPISLEDYLEMRGK